MIPIEIILLTAAFRVKNLIHTAISIRDHIKVDKDIKFHWLICWDQYNAHGLSKSELESVIRSMEIPYTIIDSGKPNQKNYGGDMFNEPLKEFMSTSEYSNPWIHILDDDNIVHPLFVRYVKQAVQAYPYKHIIWMNIMLSCGFVHSPHRYKAMVPVMHNLIVYFPDPSAILIKYNTLLNHGLYVGGDKYDLDIAHNLVGLNMDDVILTSDLGYMDNHHTFGYHNGNRTREEVDDTLSKLEDGRLEDVGIRFGGKDDNPLYFPIDHDLAIEIMRLIKQDYLKKGYIQ